MMYGSFVESQKLVVRNFDLSLEGLSSMRLVVMADLHVGPYKKRDWIERVVETINTIPEVDMVLVPGDFVYGSSTVFGQELTPLSRLAYPLYATLGNHDHDLDATINGPQEEGVRKALTDAGIIELNNASVDLDLVQIVGLDDNEFGFHDVDKAFESVDPEKGTVLLVHSPDILDEIQDRKVDLVITGHTHCGQIRIPGYGALPMTIPTRNGKKYERHLYQFPNRSLFITCGVGEVGPRARLFNPPEVVVLHINQKNK